MIQYSVPKAVFTKGSLSSLNSYGYSPHPLLSYIEWVYTLLTTSGRSLNKPIIMSITAPDPEELYVMLARIQELRTRLMEFHKTQINRSSVNPSTLVALELNTSCPNIQNHPPSAYAPSTLTPLLNVLASAFRTDRTLTIGLKLPPYVYSTPFADIVSCLDAYTSEEENPFAFLTCTNTLGLSVLYTDQILSVTPETPLIPFGPALPTTYGGLAGEAIHALSLGNVHAFSNLLSVHDKKAMRNIAIIGVGGVTTIEAVHRMHSAGAKVVGFATLLGREGVKSFEMLSRGT